MHNGGERYGALVVGHEWGGPQALGGGFATYSYVLCRRLSEMRKQQRERLPSARGAFLSIGM